ncbi:hypothetical protein ALQ08_200045 [Pseudomonas syringae pv. delphinii]|uniref:Uncharacterized protein n=1 Tax=Pseudomonas syringae pv. delphinii TaxID=192088 RepID=A0A0P9U1Y0_9PSED|nr:hypothetical protein ALO72_200129 [Pseudomonas syringae pv. delphinii]RMQ28578.1 hypothetical protein ALQ08_200045 [Pseudomonas syringae pv. delphinii]
MNQTKQSSQLLYLLALQLLGYQGWCNCDLAGVGPVNTVMSAFVR